MMVLCECAFSTTNHVPCSCNTCSLFLTTHICQITNIGNIYNKPAKHYRDSVGFPPLHRSLLTPSTTLKLFRATPTFAGSASQGHQSNERLPTILHPGLEIGKRLRNPSQPLSQPPPILYPATSPIFFGVASLVNPPLCFSECAPLISKTLGRASLMIFILIWTVWARLFYFLHGVYIVCTLYACIVVSQVQ